MVFLSHLSLSYLHLLLVAKRPPAPSFFRRQFCHTHLTKPNHCQRCEQKIAILRFNLGSEPIQISFLRLQNFRKILIIKPWSKTSLATKMFDKANIMCGKYAHFCDVFSKPNCDFDALFTGLLINSRLVEESSTIYLLALCEWFINTPPERRQNFNSGAEAKINCKNEVSLFGTEFEKALFLERILLNL